MRLFTDRRMLRRTAGMLAAAMVLSLAGGIVVPAPGMVVAVEAATRKGTVIVQNGINVRTGPGTDYDKLTVGNVAIGLSYNDEVDVVGEKDGWYQIEFKYNNKKVEGYVRNDLLKVEEDASAETTETTEKTEEKTTEEKTEEAATSTTTTTTTTTTKYKPIAYEATVRSAVKVRTGKGTEFDQVEIDGNPVTLAQGTEVIVTGERVASDGGRWYVVKYPYGGETRTDGFVSAEFVTLKVDSKNVIKSEVYRKKGVYIRNKAATGANTYLLINGKKVKLAKGKKLQIFYEVTVNGTKWFKVRFYYDGVVYSGYVMAKYTKFRREAAETTASADTTESEDTKTASADTKAEETAAEEETPAEPVLTEQDKEDLAFAEQKATLNAESVIRRAPGESGAILTDGSYVYKLKNGQSVTAKAQKTVDDDKWYLVLYETTDSEGASVQGTGYVPGSVLTLSQATVTSQAV